MKRIANRIELIGPNRCTGCSACASICPTNSITMKEDREGFLQPHILQSSCIKCHKCEHVCPVINGEVIHDSSQTKAFVVINKNEAIREKSSSGGVFYALAKWALDKNGVVFGARFNDQWEVIHECTETVDGLFPFMRSKYVQSRLGTTLKKAKSFLDEGRWVLFSGTPCQLAALRAFLGKDYDRLVQVDLVCHGVPSPRVWREFLNEIKVANNRLEDIVFREKENGWHQQSIRYVFSSTNGDQWHSVVLPIYKDDYLYGFANNYFLRRVCYQCPFKSVHRNSDITLADAWGIEKYAPEMDDNRGTSLVLIHSLKGNGIFNDSHSSLTFRDISIDDALSFNRRATSSVEVTRLRQVFFLFNHLMSVSDSVKITKMVKRIGQRIKKIL